MKVACLDPDRFRSLYDLGFSVIPLLPRSKVPPVTWRSFQRERATLDEVDSWARDPRGLNVGVVTGKVSQNRVVLDVDSPEALMRLEERYGPLPITPTVQTGRGHHFYLIDGTGRCRNFVGRIDGLDHRGEGGYVVAPGSIHPSGRVYSWTPRLSPKATPFVTVPDWLYELAGRAEAEREKGEATHFQPHWSGCWRPPRVTAYAARALDSACIELESARPGSRNATLNGTAYSLARLIAAGALDRTDVEAALAHACHVNELVQDDGERSVLATIHSGIEAGLKHPRDLSHLVRPRGFGHVATGHEPKAFR